MKSTKRIWRWHFTVVVLLAAYLLGPAVTETTAQANDRPSQSGLVKPAPKDNPSEAPRFSWKLGVRLGGNFIFPFVHEYGDAQAGLGYEGDLFFALSRKFALRATLSRCRLEGDTRLQFMKAVRYSLALERYHYFGNSQNESQAVKFWAGLGVTQDDYYYTEPRYDWEQAGLIEETKPFATFGIGMVFLLEKGLAFDFCTGISTAVRSGGGSPSGPSLDYSFMVDLQVGLVAFI